MACIPQDDIAAAGTYLTKVLLEKGTVDYSYFYNEEPGTEEMVMLGVYGDLNHPNAEEAHGFIDWATHQLVDQGIVFSRELDSKLKDGEPDYRITLTDAGRYFLETGQRPRYWTMYL